MFDRNTRLLFAIIFLVAGAFLAINLVITESELSEWGLAFILIVLAVALLLSIWREDEAEKANALVVAKKAEAAVVKAEAAVSTKKQESKPEPEPAQKPEPKAEAPAPETAPEPEPEPAPKTEIPAPEPPPAPKAAAASAQEDDLTRVEGIGAKYQEALYAAGVNTYAALAMMSQEDIEAAAKAAGLNRRASMNTWAEQAALAAKGDWDALYRLQNELSGGRR